MWTVRTPSIGSTFVAPNMYGTQAVMYTEDNKKAANMNKSLTKQLANNMIQRHYHTMSKRLNASTLGLCYPSNLLLGEYLSEYSPRVFNVFTSDQCFY